MGRRDSRNCGFLVYSLWLRFVDTPPPPGRSGIIELAKNSPQNREPKGVRGHNRENKGLTGFVFLSGPVASGSTIMCAFFSGRKVRCHRVAVEKTIKDGDGSAAAKAFRPKALIERCSSIPGGYFFPLLDHFIDPRGGILWIRLPVLHGFRVHSVFLAEVYQHFVYSQANI